MLRCESKDWQQGREPVGLLGTSRHKRVAKMATGLQEAYLSAEHCQPLPDAYKEYKEIRRGLGRSFFLPSRSWAADFCKTIKSHSRCRGLTSVGCGEAFFEWLLSEHWPHMAVRGVDIGGFHTVARGSGLLPQAYWKISYANVELEPSCPAYVPSDNVRVQFLFIS